MLIPAVTALRPELDRLVEAGVFARADAVEGARGVPESFGALALAATRRGELTADQAESLVALLGLRPANDRA